MSWTFAPDRPIHTQLVDMIRKGILAGKYPPGTNMPSVRGLALEAGVNPNTMQRALVDLESQGLLFTQRTSGRTVTTDERLIMQLRDSIATECVELYFKEMGNLGFDRNQAIEVFWSKANSIYAPATMVPEGYGGGANPGGSGGNPGGPNPANTDWEVI